MKRNLMHGLVSDPAPMCMVTKPYDGEYGVTLNKCHVSAGNSILFLQYPSKIKMHCKHWDLPMITLAT